MSKPSADAERILEYYLDYLDVAGVVCRCYCEENAPAKEAARRVFERLKKEIIASSEGPVRSATGAGILRGLGDTIREVLQEHDRSQRS